MRNRFDVNPQEIYRRLQIILSELPRLEAELEVMKVELEGLFHGLKVSYIREGHGVQAAHALAKGDPRYVERALEVARLEARVKELRAEKALLSKMIDLLNAEVLGYYAEIKALTLDIDM